MAASLTLVIPCYNEEQTLATCIENVLGIADEDLSLEVIIVDDASRDSSLSIAHELAKQNPEIKVFSHKKNQGKGAALRTGFREATGDFVIVQDADLEYRPSEIKTLLKPLIDDEADVVIGSRFSSSGAHRVLYFWHSVGNRFLTLLSNMFTDLNLTDMETCYKVFKREVIQNIEIEENRFGFEPEIIAKIAHKRLRIFEMGISYFGRTYDEGKKIGIMDGFRALYCIFHYNANKAPLPIQLLIYLFIGGVSAIFNFVVFMGLLQSGLSVSYSALAAFVLAAVVNYLLSVAILFRRKAKWGFKTEILIYAVLVLILGGFDVAITQLLVNISVSAGIAKILATALTFILNFIGRKYIVFYEQSSGPWSPQRNKKTVSPKDKVLEDFEY